MSRRNLHRRRRAEIDDPSPAMAQLLDIVMTARARLTPEAQETADHKVARLMRMLRKRHGEQRAWLRRQLATLASLSAG